jgi:hypothetical protein
VQLATRFDHRPIEGSSYAEIRRIMRAVWKVSTVMILRGDARPQGKIPTTIGHYVENAKPTSRPSAPLPALESGRRSGEDGNVWSALIQWNTKM